MPKYFVELKFPEVKVSQEIEAESLGAAIDQFIKDHGAAIIEDPEVSCAKNVIPLKAGGAAEYGLVDETDLKES